MNSTEFNNKYEKYLEKGHYGLDINYPKVIEFLDKIFDDLTQIPGFSYSQIKTKFNSVRFYSTLSIELSSLIEEEIERILNEEEK